MKSRFESTNFLTNIISLVFYALSAWGIVVTIQSTELVDAIFSKNIEYIVGTAVPALINIGFKLWQKIKTKTLVWKDVLKSRNFVTQAITTVSVIVTAIGVLIPETAPQELTNAIFGGSITLLITALLANVVNPIWHFITDKKNKA